MRLKYEIVNVTRDYDKIEILSVEDDFPYHPMGGIDHIPAHAASFTGTPKEVVDHVQELRRKGHAYCMKIDGALMNQVVYCVSELHQVALGRKKVFEVEISRWVRDEEEA